MDLPKLGDKTRKIAGVEAFTLAAGWTRRGSQGEKKLLGSCKIKTAVP